MRLFASFLILLSTFLVSCSAQTVSAAQVQTAIAETQLSYTPTDKPTNTPASTSTVEPSPIVAVEETATPTIVPISQLNFEPLLILQNDLPAGYSGAQVSNIAPGMFRDIPKAQYVIVQQFEYQGQRDGGVSVFVYEKRSDAVSAYEIIKDGFGGGKETKDAGEKITVVSNYTTDAVFIECQAVVHTRMVNAGSADSSIAYARRLSERIKPFICR